MTREATNDALGSRSQAESVSLPRLPVRGEAPDDAGIAPADDGKVMIVGGYGQVGRSLAAWLAPQFPNRVIVAGRNSDKAATCADEIGYGAVGREIEILGPEKPDELDEVRLVVVCLDQLDTRFAELCIAHGIHYIDISADDRFLARVEVFDRTARQHGSTVVLSVGVAPGLTNMLAAHAMRRMTIVERIDVLLEIGLGDHHGRAAVEWMFDNLDAHYDVMENGQPRKVRSFGESIMIKLPDQRHVIPAYRFNFSDQHVIARTLHVASVSTWVRFDDRIATWILAMASRAGLGSLVRTGWLRRLAVWLFINVRLGSDTCGIAVRAVGRGSRGERSLTVGLIGRKEARMTAIVAAETVRQLLSGGAKAGVFHSHQIVDLEMVIEALCADQKDFVVAL